MPLVIRSFQDLNCRTLSNALAKSFILGSWRPSRGKVESIADSCPWLFNSCFEPQHPGVPSSAARLLLKNMKSIRLAGWLAGRLRVLSPIGEAAPEACNMVNILFLSPGHTEIATSCVYKDCPYPTSACRFCLETH